jgi:hypothetical protein
MKLTYWIADAWEDRPTYSIRARTKRDCAAERDRDGALRSEVRGATPMFDYQKEDRGWCGDRSRGASMGRSGNLSADVRAELRVRRVPLDEGGYDPGGSYWGSGEGTLPLFCIFNDEGEAYVRAATFEAAKAHFPFATWTAEAEVSEEDIADMVEGYITCALWSSNDESDDSGGQPLDANYTSADIDEDTRAAMVADVKKFAQDNAAVLLSVVGHGKYDWANAGHDLWLTRNHHGAGFWDGDLPKAEGEALSEAARKLGEVYLYVNADGKVYSDI